METTLHQRIESLINHYKEIGKTYNSMMIACAERGDFERAAFAQARVDFYKSAIDDLQRTL